MEFIHEPVLLQEVLEWMGVKPDGVYCDGTLGGGGHSGAMLRLSGGTATLYGIDRDMTISVTETKDQFVSPVTS